MPSSTGAAPRFVVGASDARGALADATLASDGKTVTLIPAAIAPDLTIGGDQNQHVKLTLFGTNVNAIAKPGARFRVTSALRVLGRTSDRGARVRQDDSPWRCRAIGAAPDLTAASCRPAGPSTTTGILRGLAGAVHRARSACRRARRLHHRARCNGARRFVHRGRGPVSVRQPIAQVRAAVCGAALPLVLRVRGVDGQAGSPGAVHPGRSCADHLLSAAAVAGRAGRLRLGAFCCGGAATVGLLSANAGWIFASRVQGSKSVWASSQPLYTLIYLLLRLEDNALLVGAIASFLAITAAMYFTRGIDWYSSLPAATEEVAGRVSVVPREHGNRMIAPRTRPLSVKFILPALTEATDPYWRPIKYSLFPPLGLATTLARVLVAR